MDKAKILEDIGKSGINLQLDVIRKLNNDGWKCEVDKLYTDDETNITREIDVIATKFFDIDLQFNNKKEVFKKEHKKIINKFNFLDEMKVKVTLVVECKYLKDNNNWIFFPSKDLEILQGLSFLIKRFSYPIFRKDSIFSIFTYTKFSKLNSFRKNKNIVFAETALESPHCNKKNIRDSLLKTIKYLVFELRDSCNFGIRASLYGLKNTLDLMLNQISLKYSNKFFGSYNFTPLQLEIFYPIVITNKEMIFNKSKNELIKKSHMIITQSYLSRNFLNKSDINSICSEDCKDSIRFYVDFLKISILPDFLKNINLEINKISNMTGEIFKNYANELLIFKKREDKYGAEKANSLAKIDEYGRDNVTSNSLF